MLSESAASMPAATQAAWKALVARSVRAVPLAELHARKIADLLDDSGLGDVCSNARGPLDDFVPADNAAHARRAFNAVLERENRRSLRRQPAQRLSAALSVSRIFTAKMIASACRHVSTHRRQP